jgi:hypothetical protein
MKTTLMIAAVLAGAGAAYAQDPPPPAQTVPAASQTASTPGPLAKSTTLTAERIREVKMMEGILANAVAQGATELARQMLTADPGSVISTGTARARGIALEGYGVLFDVDVPLMNMSVMWSRNQIVVQEYLDRISTTRRLRARATDPGDQQNLDAQIQLLQRTLDNFAPRQASPAMPVAQDATQAPAGSVVAQSVDVAAVPPLLTRSTNDLYTDAIKKALMEAMINHSSALMLSDDEWLTVAARDNAGPTIPGTVDDRSGIILRIKGSDLAAFRANKLIRDEVLKKVEILEWR